MAQITIYLDDETATLMKTAVKQAGISQSQWIAEAVRQRTRKEWPASVRTLAGAWRDFPTAEQIRKRQGRDTPRERL
jgi:hypothetical protein